MHQLPHSQRNRVQHKHTPQKCRAFFLDPGCAKREYLRIPEMTVLFNKYTIISEPIPFCIRSEKAFRPGCKYGHVLTVHQPLVLVSGPKRLFGTDPKYVISTTVSLNTKILGDLGNPGISPKSP